MKSEVEVREMLKSTRLAIIKASKHLTWQSALTLMLLYTSELVLKKVLDDPVKNSWTDSLMDFLGIVDSICFA